MLGPVVYGLRIYTMSNDWGKNQYHKLTMRDAEAYNNIDLIPDVNAHSMVCRMVVGLCLVLIILSLWSISLKETGIMVVVGLDCRQPVLRETSARFLSYGLDSSLLRDMKNLPINNTKFVTLARHLSPAYVRIGGTSADCLVFNQTSLLSSHKIYNPITGGDITNFTITDEDFLALGHFAANSQARMIFDLNALLRNSDGYWNASNAQQIIAFAKGHNLELDWQLGNEPNSFCHVFNREVTATQLATDYKVLRKLLDTSGYDFSDLIGPEVNHIGDVNHKGEEYVTEFLRYAESSVTYVSWHQYYLNGREAKVEDFINPVIFNYLPGQIESMANVINTGGQDVHMWLSETSSAYGGGAPELSDRFVAGFLWLDKLGYSASVGVNVVTRQSFFGGNYALVSPNLTPNPDWWVSVAYKKFVSSKVLHLKIPNNFGQVRLYAHCTPESSLLNKVPAITIYGVNIANEPATISVQIFYLAAKKYNLFLYALTADHLQSSLLQMNGNTLVLQENGELPPFVPIIFEPNEIFSIPAYSMVFIVLHGVDVPACMV